MSYTTIDSSCHISSYQRQSLTRNASLASSRPKSSSLSIAPITKTISNYFFKPEKLPLAFQEKAQHRTVVKPFFTKNRKLLSTNCKRNNHIPNGFKNMLRAKSTVIKQKKFQQFYINRQGREVDLDKTKKIDFQLDNNQSNLFRSNFPMKKTKHKNANSASLERRGKHHPVCHIDVEVQKLPTKAVTIQSLTEDLSEMALRQKQVFFNSNNKLKQNSPQAKINWRNLRKKPRQLIDKQNMQFMIEPWGGTQCQDVCF